MDEWRDRREAVNSGWVPGKSAWETAYAWVGSGQPAIPPEFTLLLNSHDMTRETIFERGVVECKTPLRYRGGPRNHDVAVWGRKEGRRCFIGVESKANDGFGATVQDQLDGANDIRRKGKNTNQDMRADWLSRILIGYGLLQGNDHNEVRDLPYQVLAGVAGTMFAAKASQCALAVFVVHQFRTEFTDDQKIATDAECLELFASLLVQRNTARGLLAQLPLQYGVLLGPIYFANRKCGAEQWDMPTNIPLFIGKVFTDRT